MYVYFFFFFNTVEGPQVHVNDTDAEPFGWPVRAAAAVTDHVSAQHTQFFETNGGARDHTDVQIHG